MEGQKKRLLHITEVSSGGVLPVIADISNRFADSFEIFVAYGVREDTPGDLAAYFDPSVTLIPVRHFTRRISPGEDARAMAEIRRIVRDIRPHVVHLHSTKAGAVGRLAVGGRRRPVFYTPHGYCFLKKDDSRLRRIFYLLAEWALAKTGCTTVACGREEYDLAGRLGQRAVLIRNGIDLRWVEERAAERAGEALRKKSVFTVYTAGRIGPQKNPELFNEIAGMCPDIRFVWIGGGEDAGKLKSRNITVTGFVDRQKAVELAAGYDVFLLPSLWEGLSISLLEAMSLGKVCLVSDIKANRDVVRDGENGFLCGCREEYLLRISQARRESLAFMAENARREAAEKYGMEAVRDRYLNLYQKAMADFETGKKSKPRKEPAGGEKERGR